MTRLNKCKLTIKIHLGVRYVACNNHSRIMYSNWRRRQITHWRNTGLVLKSLIHLRHSREQYTDV